MSSPAKPGKSEYIVEADGCQIDLKNPYLAALLLLGSWCWPLLQLYQGRTNKAYLYAACILGLFFLVVFRARPRGLCVLTPEDYRIQFPAQVCVGCLRFPLLCSLGKGRSSPRASNAPAAPSEWKWSEFMAPPQNLNTFRNGITRDPLDLN